MRKALTRLVTTAAIAALGLVICAGEAGAAGRSTVAGSGLTAVLGQSGLAGGVAASRHGSTSAGTPPGGGVSRTPGGGSAPPTTSTAPPPPAWITTKLVTCRRATSGMCDWQIPNPGQPGGVPLACHHAMHACDRLVPIPTASTSSGTSTVGQVGWSGSAQPVTVARWAVVYGGQTYTYGGSVGLSTGYTIRAVCTGQPTSGVVEFWLNVPATSGPPAPWQLAGPLPAAVSAGPYASTFTVPACSPSDQQPAKVSLVPGAGPSVANGYHVTANGTFYPYTFDPVVVGGVDQELVWDGGTASVSGYPPTVENQLGPAYPRWQIQGPTGGYGMANTASRPNVTVKVALHAPSNAGNPYTLGVAGTYSAYWEYWYIDVSAQATAVQQSAPVEVRRLHNPTCTWVHHVHGRRVVITRYPCPWWQTSALTYSYLTGVGVSGTTVQRAPSDPQSARYTVGASTKVAAVQPMIVAGT